MSREIKRDLNNEGRRPRRATTHPNVQGAVAARAQKGLEELSHVEGQEGILLVQGKEQRLHFAGAAVKRYPTTKVRETQVRQ